MNVAADTCCVFDLEPGYRQYLQHHLSEMGMAMKDIVLNLGQKAGNLLATPLQKLKEHAPIDLLCAGPPCPPWAGQGLKKSTRDPRAHVFLKILEWVVYAIHACGLLACVLEAA